MPETTAALAYGPGSNPTAVLSLWSGRIFLWPARALFIAHAADTAVHAHHAVQLCLSLEAPFKLRRGIGSQWGEFDFALIGPDQPHQLNGGGARLALLYLDPESDEGRALVARAAGGSFALPTRGDLGLRRELIYACADRADAPEAAFAAVTELLRFVTPSTTERHPMDSRVNRLLERLRSQPQQALSAAVAAGELGLSSHRFQHVFRESTGVPFRRYLLWLRLVAAVTRIASGSSMTTAAHAVGFADSAHLSRTFRRMFGLTPSALAKSSEFIQARPPPIA